MREGGASMRQREAIQAYLYQLVHGEKPGPVGMLILMFLRASSWIYGAGLTFKLNLYRWGLLKRHKLPCKVISLGNVTVGGTGKTPTAQRLAAIIRDMGYRVVILNRGYRAKWRGTVGLVSDGERTFMTASEAGDEAFLLAKNLPGVPVVIGRNRALTGEYAVRQLGAQVVILDDGYQHWQLMRDFDIVLIDTLNVFGNSFLLPRGTLREPLEHLDRAHACLLTKVDQSSDDTRDVIRSTVRRYNPQAAIIESIHQPRHFIEIQEWYKGRHHQKLSLQQVAGQRVMALSAIGNPSSFEQTIADIGAFVAASKRYADHHDYTMAEMQQVMQEAVSAGVKAIITTEKDAVKIPAEFIHSERPLPVYILGIELRFMDDCYEQLLKLIAQVMAGEERRK